jgi:hypothetical protein
MHAAVASPTTVIETNSTMKALEVCDDRGSDLELFRITDHGGKQFKICASRVSVNDR